jgi:hypothetical protein
VGKAAHAVVQEAVNVGGMVTDGPHARRRWRGLRILWPQGGAPGNLARARDEAALLARLSPETCLVGLYCLHSGDAVTRLTASEYKAAKRVVSCMTAPRSDAADLVVRRGRDRHVADVDSAGVSRAQSKAKRPQAVLRARILMAGLVALRFHYSCDYGLDNQIPAGASRRPVPAGACDRCGAGEVMLPRFARPGITWLYWLI